MGFELREIPTKHAALFEVHTVDEWMAVSSRTSCLGLLGGLVYLHRGSFFIGWADWLFFPQLLANILLNNRVHLTRIPFLYAIYSSWTNNIYLQLSCH